jgi:hypothetical protein
MQTTTYQMLEDYKASYYFNASDRGLLLVLFKVIDNSQSPGLSVYCRNTCKLCSSRTKCRMRHTELYTEPPQAKVMVILILQATK